MFEVAETSAAGAISRNTVFEFREHDDGVIEAGYHGGQIVSGRLAGHRQRDRVTAAYGQLSIDGRRQTGTASMRIEQAADGHLLLTEDHTWAARHRPATCAGGPVTNRSSAAWVRWCVITVAEVTPSGRTTAGCQGQDCLKLFVASRPARRWCDSTTCGNRTRVRAHSNRRVQSEDQSRQNSLPSGSAITM